MVNTIEGNPGKNEARPDVWAMMYWTKPKSEWHLVEDHASL